MERGFSSVPRVDFRDRENDDDDRAEEPQRDVLG
jgi:hypothetical protein